MPSLDTITKRFQSADRNTRLELLLDFSERLPVLPEKYREAVAQGINQVSECQTPVFLYPEIHEGKFMLYADVPREAPTVRGFVALLIKALNGAPLADVQAVPADLFDRLGLTELLGMTRTQGLSAIVGRVRRMGTSPPGPLSAMRGEGEPG